MSRARWASLHPCPVLPPDQGPPCPPQSSSLIFLPSQGDVVPVVLWSCANEVVLGCFIQQQGAVCRLQHNLVMVRGPFISYLRRLQ